MGGGFIIYFGEFTEGALAFPDIEVDVLPNPGGLLLFNASRLHRKMKECTGRREALVLFAHGAQFFSSPQPLLCTKGNDEGPQPKRWMKGEAPGKKGGVSPAANKEEASEQERSLS